MVLNIFLTKKEKRKKKKMLRNEGLPNRIGQRLGRQREPIIALKPVVGGTSTSKNTRWRMDTQWSLPWIQASVYAYQRENLTVAAVGRDASDQWARGEFVADALEIRDRIPVWLRLPVDRGGRGVHRH